MRPRDISRDGSQTRPASLLKHRYSDSNPVSLGRFYVLVLYENLKCLAHAFRIDQRFKQQPCARTLALAHPFRLQFRKFTLPRERHQERGLRGEPGAHQAGAFSPMIESRKVHVRRQILFARRTKKILARAVPLVSK